MIFAGISGTITAEAAGLGKLEMPMLEKAGFDKSFSVGLISASAIIGPIIPPSVQMILYGVIAEQSIGRLFVGGIIPGFILGGIITGLFTPTEAAVVAVVYALFISLFVYKSLKLKQLPQLLVGSAVMTALILLIMGAASVFG